MRDRRMSGLLSTPFLLPLLVVACVLCVTWSSRSTAASQQLGYGLTMRPRNRLMNSRPSGCIDQICNRLHHGCAQRSLSTSAQLDDGRIQFSDAQISRFLKARQDVPSGNGDRYWDEIARRVGGGITGYECKRLAQNQLFKKSAGTSQNFFKNFVDVQGEYVESGYVDQNAADPMSQMSNFFGGLFGKKEIEYSEDGFYVGQAVQYKSATFGKWMDAKVVGLNKDGTIDLNCRDNADPKLIRA